MRLGLLAEKVGMTRIFTPDGDHVPVTVLRVDDCEVTANRTVEKDGYAAVQLAAARRRPSGFPRPCAVISPRPR